MPTREQVKRFAQFFGTDENELLIAYLSDKLVHELLNEEMAVKAMQENVLDFLLKLRQLAFGFRFLRLFGFALGVQIVHVPLEVLLPGAVGGFLTLMTPDFSLC